MKGYNSPIFVEEHIKCKVAEKNIKISLNYIYSLIFILIPFRRNIIDRIICYAVWLEHLYSIIYVSYSIILIIYFSVI